MTLAGDLETSQTLDGDVTSAYGSVGGGAFRAKKIEWGFRKVKRALATDGSYLGLRGDSLRDYFLEISNKETLLMAAALKEGKAAGPGAGSQGGYATSPTAAAGAALVPISQHAGTATPSPVAVSGSGHAVDHNAPAFVPTTPPPELKKDADRTPSHPPRSLPGPLRVTLLLLTEG